MLLTIINCTGSSYKEVPTGGSAAWTVTANSGYTTTGATFSPAGCGTISGSTVTISNVTGPHTCTVTLQSSDPLKSFTYTGDYAIKKASDYNLDTSNGDYTVLALLGDGTLTFLTDFEADVFLVGGGSSGKYANTTTGYGGGGGGGGFTKTVRVTFGTSGNAVVIGAGGAARSSGEGTFNAGEDTTISIDGTTYTAEGAKTSPRTSPLAGVSGGSGGGTGTADGNERGGKGGYDGDNGEDVSTSAGADPGVGQGTTTRAFGESSGTLFAGGGGGGGDGLQAHLGSHSGAGGSGGGGSGGYSKGISSSAYVNATAGVDNTGGGGGGGGYPGTSSKTSVMRGAAGGSGIILIRVHK